MKLVHLVGFVIKKFLTMHGHVDVKVCQTAIRELLRAQPIPHFGRITSRPTYSAFLFTPSDILVLRQRYGIMALSAVDGRSDTAVCLHRQTVSSLQFARYRKRAYLARDIKF